MKKDREKKQKYSNITDATTMSSTAEESALHASTNREHFSAWDRLEEISKRKINPNYINQNINQQAGYSAEIKEQARVNVHNILAGKRERVRQYDDLSSEKKSQVKKFFPNYATPSKNHELVDYVSVDKKGNVIPGTLTQSKFVGRNGEECFKKLLSKDYEKYFENGAKMNVPKDYYRDIQKAADAKIESLESQIAKQKGLGDFQKSAHLEEKLQKCKTIKAHTRPASATKREAIEARLNPNLSTAKDVTSVSHQAGMNAAQTGALIGGGVSLATNVYECVANGKDPIKAIKHTAIATLKGGALSYGSAFASSSLGGWMQSSANKIIQSLGKGSAPAMIVGAGVANCKVFIDYFRGKIDEAELPIAGFAARISPGLLSLLGLMRAMGCASFWI
nr:YkgJ family cysteine cluster protein [Helicobacter pylori]